ncbi:MAG: XdhC family protein [Burkholderiales bacterium]
MKELEKIVNEAQAARAAGRTAALATVVGIEGSAYRLPGARMLIVDDRWVAGSISGGCLEDDVVLRAREAVAENEASTATYDTTSDDDVVFGVGLGCKGIITILIEPVSLAGSGVDFIAFAKRCLDERVTGAAATVIRTEGTTSVRIGSRLVSRAGAVQSDIAHATLEAKIITALPGLEGASLIRLQLEGGAAFVFVERIDPPTPLIVFGAGHDAMPVVRLAKDLGWHVTLVDHRPAYATPERFPDADRIVVGTPAEVFARLTLDAGALALVMTHNYLRDLELLGRLLPSPVRYLGVLGPRRRTDQLLADLKEKGVEPDSAQLERLYAPVGLDIGSEGPAEVAMSILSEMQAVMTRHRGGYLRERKRPIHQREEAPSGAR